MKKPSFILLCLLSCLPLLSVAQASAPEPQQTLPAIKVEAGATQNDSAQMERDLQQLSWEQFRGIIETIPKMKADIEVYGVLGWQYVKQNYVTHHWKKNIDRLDSSQKQRLAELIQASKVGK